MKKSGIFRIVISVGLIGVLFYYLRGHYVEIVTEIKRTNPWLLLGAFAVYNFNLAITTLRLKALLRSESVKISFTQLNEFNYIGFFFNNFLPSSIGGDIAKAYFIGHATKLKAKSYVSVFMDRLTGLFSFAAIGLVSVLLGWDAVKEPGVKESVLIFVLLCVIVAVVALNATIAKYMSRILSKIHFKGIGDKLIKVYNMLHEYRNRKKVLIYTMLLSTISQAAYFYVIYVLFQSMGAAVTIKQVFVIMPLICVITLLPSLGGLGLREGAILVLFGAIVGRQKAAGVSVLLYLILFALSLIGGIIFLTSPQLRKLKIKTDEDVIV